MRYEDPEHFFEILSKALAKRIAEEIGLANFISERLQFEGWLKVVLVSELVNFLGRPVFVEHEIDSKERIDVVIPGLYALELKVITTNYVAQCVSTKNKDITNQIQNLISDLRKLSDLKEQSSKEQPIILGLSFPIPSTSYSKCSYSKWQRHVARVLLESKRYFPHIRYRDYRVNLPCSNRNSVPGVIFTFYDYDDDSNKQRNSY